MASKKSFLLRIDPKIYDAMESWAADEMRSVNSHIEYLLRESLKKAGRLPGPARQSPETPENDEDDSPSAAPAGKKALIDDDSHQP